MLILILSNCLRSCELLFSIYKINNSNNLIIIILIFGWDLQRFYFLNQGMDIQNPNPKKINAIFIPCMMRTECKHIRWVEDYFWKCISRISFDHLAYKPN